MPAGGASARSTATCSTSTTGSRRRCCESGLVCRRSSYCLKCSHLFNILDASGSIGVTERTAYILRVRQLAVGDREGATSSDEAARPERDGEADADAMDRELLLEIGCRGTAGQLAAGADDAARRASSTRSCRRSACAPDAPVETFSTPRRLTVRVARIAERQDGSRRDSSTGRRCRPRFDADGTADAGGARLREEAGRRRSTRSSACRRRRASTSRSASASAARAPSTRCRTCSAACCATWRSRSRCTGTRCSTTAGASCCSAGRSAGCCSSTAAASCRSRSARTPSARGPAGAGRRRPARVTYGHRFLTTSGRAGRAIKVRSFDEYRARLPEHFVILEHAERRDRIARELDAQARRLGGRVAAVNASTRRCSRKSPTWSSIPASSPASSRAEFLELPRGSADDDAGPSSALLSGRRRRRQAEGSVSGGHQHASRTTSALIAQNAERVVTARLRDAKFFWDADRKTTLESRLERLRHAAVPQEARQLPRQGGADRARWRGGSPRDALGAAGDGRRTPRTAARLAKADLDDRHGARVHRAAGHDGRHLRARGRAARGGLEGDLLPLPADRRRSGRAADARAARRRRR